MPKIDKSNAVALAKSVRNSMIEEDEFLLQPLQNLTLKEIKRFVYFWFDKNIYNEENEKYMAYLKDKGIIVEGFASMQAMEDSMRAMHLNKKLKIITAASHENHYYKKLQN